MLGTLLKDRYEIAEQIGQGGMGTVYRAKDVFLQREVALKVLLDSTLDDKGRARLLREARAVAKLNHPNIVTVYDAGEEEGNPFVVMELVRGQSLYENKPETNDDIIWVARQICEALQHAHDEGIVHRDLKPENVLMTTTGVAKLMDFGLARNSTNRITTQGGITGTVSYLAPEMAMDNEFDGRADLYSLGVMLYEFSVGKLPFIAADPVGVIYHHLHTNPLPPREANAAISPALNSLILHLMQKEPGDRPQTAREVERFLANIKIDPNAAYTAFKESAIRRGSESNQGLARARKITTPVGIGTTEIAIHKLLEQWRQQGISVLEPPSIAIVMSSSSDLTFDYENLVYLLRSSLYHAMDVQQWRARAESDAHFISALFDIWKEYPKPAVRLRVVETLKDIVLPDATEVLVEIAVEDHDHEVRSAAAVESARRGAREKVIAQLMKEMAAKRDPTATAAFVAIADQVGLPEKTGPYPRLEVGIALARLRWRANRKQITRQTVRAGVMGGIAIGLMGSLLPLIAFVANPVVYQQNVEQVTPLGWVLSGMMAGAVWGALQGIATGFLVGVADALSWPHKRKRNRLVLGAFSGLVYAIFSILFSSAGMLSPVVDVAIYVPVYLVYGALLGTVLTTIVPALGVYPTRKEQLKQATRTFATMLLVAAPSIVLIYRGLSGPRLVLDIVFAALMSLGLALGLSMENPDE